MKSFLCALIAFLSLGCAGTNVNPTDVLKIACNPVSAYTPERCAEAIGDVWNVYSRRIHELRTDPGTPADVVRTIQRVDREVTPVVTSVLDASIALKQAQATGAPIEDRRAALDAQVQAALPLVRSLPQL